MTYDSPFRPPSGHMSPAALTLAVALHALVAAALWWISPLRVLDQSETAITVTLEPQPSGGAPASGGEAASGTSEASAAPAVPAAKDARPEAPAESQPEPAQVAAAPDPAQPQETAASGEEAQPDAAEAQKLWQTDASSWKPQVTVEQSLPPPAAAPPPPTARDLVKSPPKRATSTVRPVQRAQVAPPPRPAQPSSQRGPSAEQQTAARLPAPSGGSMDSLTGHGGQRNDYLSRVARQIAQFREYPAIARQNRQQGRVVMRVTITRAGHLLDVSVDRSSGWPAIDAAELATIRRSGKFPDVPGSMPGDPIVLILPVTYSVR